jgi:hypothetical protein
VHALHPDLQAGIAEQHRRREQLLASESGWSEPAASSRAVPAHGSGVVPDGAARRPAASRPTSAGQSQQPGDAC